MIPNIRKGIRSALRGLFGRGAKKTSPDQKEPEVSEWSETDHQAQQGQSEEFFDPWEREYAPAPDKPVNQVGGSADGREVSTPSKIGDAALCTKDSAETVAVRGSEDTSSLVKVAPEITGQAVEKLAEGVLTEPIESWAKPEAEENSALTESQSSQSDFFAWDEANDYGEDPIPVDIGLANTSYDNGDGFFDFEPKAHQSPWSGVSQEEPSVWRARERAARIVNILGLETAGEERTVLQFLTDFFEQFDHPATFDAIFNLAIAGLDLSTLYAMVELKRVWIERSDWWLCRNRRGIEYLTNGSSALTWTLAHRICLARQDYTPETMIDEDWLSEWMALRFGAAGYYSFPAYVFDKVANVDAGNLCDGLTRRESEGSYFELGDDYDWFRKVPDRSAVIADNFHILTPFDDRPGVVRFEDEEEGAKDAGSAS